MQQDHLFRVRVPHVTCHVRVLPSRTQVRAQQVSFKSESQSRCILGMTLNCIQPSDVQGMMSLYELLLLLKLEFQIKVDVRLKLELRLQFHLQLQVAIKSFEGVDGFDICTFMKEIVYKMKLKLGISLAAHKARPSIRPC